MPKINQPLDQISDHQTFAHTPVLLKEVLHLLQPKEGESYLDVTVGGGGHAAAILEQTKSSRKAVLVDRDETAIRTLRRHFGKNGAQIIHQDFLSASRELVSKGKKFDMVLADLGASSQHFEDISRGFAIKRSGPLDMRMDRRQELTAEQIVNGWNEARLAELLKEYGQEPKAKTIAGRIIARRPIHTTQELATIVTGLWPRRSKVHPATRTFQALRIAVNEELAQLEQSLPLWVELLASGGRLAVISFHSLEDRKVKHFFKQQAGGTYDSELTLLTKKPLTPSHNEIVSNPRARSARLRAVAKIKTNRKGNGQVNDD